MLFFLIINFLLTVSLKYITYRSRSRSSKNSGSNNSENEEAMRQSSAKGSDSGTGTGGSGQYILTSFSHHESSIEHKGPFILYRIEVTLHSEMVNSK